MIRRPIAWDVPLTRPYSRRADRAWKTWSDLGRRWVNR